jgi:Uma2 family endonuclease
MSPYTAAHVFSNFDVVEPDLLYISNERAAEVATPQNLQGAPEIVVEVAAKATRKRDATIKRRLYERWGVDEYWIVDPGANVVRVDRRAGDRFAQDVELSREAGDVLTTPLLPGLRARLADVFRD